MNITSYQYPVFEPYKEATLEIYISGCNRNCKGCHAEELKDFNNGSELKLKDVQDKLIKYDGFYDSVSILGGDLLCQDEQEVIIFSAFLNSYLRSKGKKLWLFTGANTVPDWCKKYYDVIKYGEYREDLYQEGFPASSNQRIIRKGIDYK